MSKIEPALTAEEWAEAVLHKHSSRSEAFGFATWEASAQDRHALAALCLHGQPFGFTREDVEELRWVVEDIVNPEGARALEDLADRIEALLPPGEQGGTRE